MNTLGAMIGEMVYFMGVCRRMGNEYRTILDILSTALFGYSISLPDSVNWTALYEEAISQAVFTLVYSVAEDSIPSNFKVQWDDVFYRYIAYNMRINFEHAELHKLMESNNIPYVILKASCII